jgi:hypothetical protein
MANTSRPVARKADLLTEELDDELLVFDDARQLACRLNRTAALVWQNSDGERTVDDLVELLREELGELADEDLVMVTLDRLDEQGLIESGFARRDPGAARVSRRRFIRRVGVVGTAALALPVVQSIVAPTSAAAQSEICGYCVYCECSDACYCEPPCTCPCGCSAGQQRAFEKRYKR